MLMTAVRLALALLSLSPSVHSDQEYFLPIDCDDIHRHDNNTPSGVYTIYPGGPLAPLKVFCDMASEGGGWTVFQRRMDGTESFFRPWKHYKDGFGNVAGEYWLGLENIFLLTSRKKNELQVDIEDWDGFKAYASYSSFSIDHENSGYELRLGTYTRGMAGDSFRSHNNMKFTTFDKDNDNWDKNCAQHCLGGFWYNNCHTVNPNGMYAPHGAIVHENTRIVWAGFRGENCSLKKIEMKIRPASRCACNE